MTRSRRRTENESSTMNPGPGREWGSIEASGMLFNASLLGIDGVVDALEAIYHKWEERDKK